METNIPSIEHLQLLLKQEEAARKKAEAQIARMQSALKAATGQEPKVNPAVREAAEENNIFQEIITALPGIVFQIQKNEEGIFVFNFISPELHQMLGMQLTNLNQTLPLLHPEDRSKWMDSLEATYKEAKNWKQEIRFMMPDGTIYWWLSSAVSSYSSSGELVYNGIIINITRQKQAELSLKESEKKWRYALEGAGDGLWEYRVDARQMNLSTNCMHLLGYSNAEYASNPLLWRRSIHPEDLPAVKLIEADYQAGLAEAHSIQYRIRNKSGSYIWIMDRGIVFSRDSEGNPVHFIGVHTNIDHLKQTELELTTTSITLSTLVTNMQDGIIIENVNNEFLLCNQAFCNIFDISLSPEELRGQGINQLLAAHSNRIKDFGKFMARRYSLLSSGKTAINDEVELISGKYLLRDYAPLIINGSPSGHLWKYTDITQAKIAATRVLEAEKRYRNLIENMQVGLVEFDMSENIIYANTTFYEMCGYHKEEISGNSLERLFGEYKPLVDQKRDLRVKGISDAYEVEIVTKSGEKRWWYISGAPRQNDQLITIATIGACLDITQQKKLEYELRYAKQIAEQLSNSKDLFLANMSHEIRTPLNAIFGMTNLMKKTELLSQQQFYLNTISNSSSSLMVIINDILDFSKISVGKLTLERIGFRMQDLIAASMSMVAYRAQEKGLQLLLNDEQCYNGVILGDPFRLKQVFINLLTNAVKFTKQGSVSINCMNMGIHNGLRHLTIQVKDTGRGMEEAFLKILFDKFTQEDESIARSYSGTGLGMSISKHLIELMNGTISVESTKYVGTTFNLNLFFEEGTDADLFVDEDELIDIAVLVNKRILLVEDNDMNQLVAKTLLEQNGLNVSIASNGLDAINCVHEKEFDLVLMDMQMPVMDGLTATTIIRKTNEQLPIIALTANALKDEQKKCISAGMNDFLAKPFEEKILLAMLCKWLDKKEKEPLFAGTSSLIVPIPDRQPSVVGKNELQPLYNLDQIQAISPGNKEFLKMLVKMFIDDAADTAAKITIAYSLNDFKTIKSLAHRIKPSIDQLVIPYAMQIRRMEELSVAEDTSGELENLVIGFEDLMTTLIPLLKAEIQDPTPDI